MSGDLQRRAVSDLIAKAEGLGLDVPESLQAIAHGHIHLGGAVLFAELHPDDTGDFPEGMLWCCAGSAMGGLRNCTCWLPVYGVDQAEPKPPTGPEDFEAQPQMCGDCAYRKDSPERTDGFTEESLLELPEKGEVFWCHEGMRRPQLWRHPGGVEVPGDPADWRPPVVGSIPYRADGRPGLVCAGWAKRRARVLAKGGH